MNPDDDFPRTQAEWVARGKAIAESGKYAPKRGKFLGRLESWGLDVYEGSPQEWKDALLAEIRDQPC
jgi:hypothetical protein